MTNLFTKVTPNPKKALNPNLLTAIIEAIIKAHAPLLTEITELKTKLTNQNTLILELTKEIDKIGKHQNSKNQNFSNLFTFTPNNNNQ